MMKTRRRARWASLGLAMLVGSVLELPLFVGDAHAIVGRPLTPVSYAGVARRTTRRTVAVAATTPAVRRW
jgi:hypothetical protein